MFNVGGGEIMVILLLALLVLGPDKLPEYARKAGRYMNEFRRMTSGFQEEFRQAMDLSDVMGTSATEPTPATGGDAIERTTEGPRLVPPVDASTTVASSEGSTTVPDDAIDTAPAQPVAPVEAPVAGAPGPSPAVSTPSSPSSPAAFTADVTPAPGPGPELITPTRPRVASEGDPGSSSAA